MGRGRKIGVGPEAGGKTKPVNPQECGASGVSHESPRVGD